MGRVKDILFTDTENEFKADSEHYSYVFIHREFLGREYQVQVGYTYYPASKGMRGEHGEPLEPDEEAAIEIGTSRLYINKRWIPIEVDTDEIIDEVWEKINS